jgi:peptidoglycan/LPS O-acetylase OafA/YrhL
MTTFGAVIGSGENQTYGITRYFHSQFQKSTIRISSFFNQRRYSEDSEELSLGLLSNHEDTEMGIEVSSNEKHRQYFDILHVPSVIRTISAILRYLLFPFTPSFINNIYRRTEPRVLHKTSFLDGLRGIASAIVVVFHIVPPREKWIEPTYGVDNHDGMGSNPLQLPFIRVLFSGYEMVHIFFVISGYVLSAKAIRLIRSENHEKLAQSLVSFIFRRGIRLFLPSIAGQIFSTALYNIWYWNVTTSLWPWIRLSYDSAKPLFNYWDWDERSTSLGQLWTIPVEFTCSMYLFLVILGVSRLQTWLRFSVVGALMLHSHACGHWAPFLFLAGMMIAEIEEIIEERKKEKDQETGLVWVSRLHTFFWVSILLIALFLAGYPMQNAEISFGLKHLAPYTPQVYLDMGERFPSYFWFSVSAPLIVLALGRLPAVQVPFTTPFMQYLGDISYSIYIIHYMPAIMFGDNVAKWAHSWTGSVDTQWKRMLCVVFEILIIMPMAIWVADIFWRFVDKPAVTFSRWMERICQKPDRAIVLGRRD